MTSPEHAETAPPPVGRDAWGWLAALSALPLVLHSLGAPLGEPVAEDFDFLHRALFGPRGQFLDGGGSAAFWRPVAHQLYYLAFGPLMLSHPRVLAALHAACLALAAWLTYRALRPAWSGRAACVAAAFPLLAESTRTLLGWPSQFVDLGLWLFTALALHETARRRLPTALVALALALMCKELAIVAVLLLPWLPAGGPRGRERLRWAVAMGAVGVVWAAFYLGVRRAQHLELPHGLEHTATSASLMTRAAWSFGNSVRSILSLPLEKAPGEAWMLAAAGVIALAIGAGLVARGRRNAPSRRGVATTAPDLRARWVLWGLAWFALSSAALMTIWPLWQPNRAAFGSIGLGIALATLAEAASPLLLGALVALRVAALLASPGPPADVAVFAPETGAFMDFAHLTRLQRLMVAVRERLHRDHPTLPHGARVCQYNMPRNAEYGFGGSRALEAWYRDSTLRWVRHEEFERDTTLDIVTIVQYVPDPVPAIALVDPRAMRLMDRASRFIAAARWPQALDDLARADSLIDDPAAGAVRAALETQRAVAFAALGRWADSERAARSAQADWPGGPSVRYWIASALAGQERWDETQAEIDSGLSLSPADSMLLGLRELLRQQVAPHSAPLAPRR